MSILTCLFGNRYSVEKIPLYDSAEDEPFTKLLKTIDSSKPEIDANGKNDSTVALIVNVKSEPLLESTSVVQPPESVLMEGVAVNIAPKTEESEEMKLYPQGTQQAFSQKNAMISRIRSNSGCRNYQIGPGPVPRTRSKLYSNGKSKNLAQKQVDAKHVAQLLASKEAQEEILRNEVRIAFSLGK